MGMLDPYRQGLHSIPHGNRVGRGIEGRIVDRVLRLAQSLRSGCLDPGWEVGMARKAKKQQESGITTTTGVRIDLRRSEVNPTIAYIVIEDEAFAVTKPDLEELHSLLSRMLNK